MAHSMRPAGPEPGQVLEPAASRGEACPALADAPQTIERVDPGAVAVPPGELERVAADRDDRRKFQSARDQHGEKRRRAGALVLLRTARGAGTQGAQGRGGVERADYYEWGGKNLDGTDGWAANRLGWDSAFSTICNRCSCRTRTDLRRSRV